MTFGNNYNGDLADWMETPILSYIEAGGNVLLITRRSRAESPDKRPLLPWFLVAFVALVIVNSMGWVPAEAHSMLTPISSWCLLTAVAALGVKTSLKALADVGPAPIGVMVLQTLLLAALVIGGLAMIR